ncbi:MAG: alpha/beta fold hydrolase [Marinilabiliales bacterium]|nr:alpha/beta fold hydrolase [Marinilabiliales bacterium]
MLDKKVRFRLRLAGFFLATLLLAGCHPLGTSDTPEPVQPDKYLVGYTPVQSLTAFQISTLYGPIQLLYPDAAAIVAAASGGVRIYSITYHTTLGSTKLVASGLVCMPENGGTFPMLSFQNGTNTLYANAPTLSYSSSTNQLLSGFASTGFVVVIPDYLGFGSSTSVFHPYLHLPSTVGPILDMYRAVKELCAKTDISAKVTSDLYLMGYSQGGLSTLQLDKTIEAEYSNEFTLKAVGGGAGPYDLMEVTKMVESTPYFPQPYYVAYLLKGFKSVGAITNPYSDVFNEPYASRIDQLFNGYNSGSAINDQLTTNMTQLFTADFRANLLTSDKYSQLRSALAASSVTPWRIKTPLLLTYGEADQDVPPAMTKNLYNGILQIDGSLPVTMISMPGLDHSLAAAPSLIAFMKKFLSIKGK